TSFPWRAKSLPRRVLRECNDRVSSAGSILRSCRPKPTLLLAHVGQAPLSPHHTIASCCIKITVSHPTTCCHAVVTSCHHLLGPSALWSVRGRKVEPGHYNSNLETAARRSRPNLTAS